MEAQVSAKVRAAIMQKCTQEEVQAVLKEIPDDETDQAVGTRVSTHCFYVNLNDQKTSHFY